MPQKGPGIPPIQFESTTLTPILQQAGTIDAQQRLVTRLELAGYQKPDIDLLMNAYVGGYITQQDLVNISTTIGSSQASALAGLAGGLGLVAFGAALPSIGVATLGTLGAATGTAAVGLSAAKASAVMSALLSAAGTTSVGGAFTAAVGVGGAGAAAAPVTIGAGVTLSAVAVYDAYQAYRSIQRIKALGINIDAFQGAPVIVPQYQLQAKHAPGGIRRTGIGEYQLPELIVEAEYRGAASFSPDVFVPDLTNAIRERPVALDLPSYDPFKGTVNDLGRRHGYLLPSLEQKSLDVLRRLIKDPTQNVSQQQGASQQLASGTLRAARGGDVAQFVRQNVVGGLFSLGFSAFNPVAALQIAGGTLLSYALGPPATKYIQDPSFSRLLEREIIGRYFYGYGPCEGTITWYNSRVLKRLTHGDPVARAKYWSEYGIAMETEEDVNRVGDLSIQDMVMYLSDGRLNKIFGIQLDNIFIELTENGSGYYVPHPDSPLRGNIFAKPFFATANPPTELENIYRYTSNGWTPEDHTPNDSYAWIGLIDTKERYWTRNGLPNYMALVVEGCHVYDLTKAKYNTTTEQMGTDHLTAAKTYTDNAASIAYAVLRDVLNVRDEEIDFNSLLNSYQIAEKYYNNPIDGRVVTSHARQPTKSRRYAISGTWDRRTAVDHIERCEVALLGSVNSVGGKIAIHAGRYPNDATGEITNERWTRDPTRVHQGDVQSHFNTVRVAHLSQAKNYSPHEFEIRDFEAIKRDGRIVALEGVITLQDIHDEPSAWRIANNLLRENRQYEIIFGEIAGIFTSQINEAIDVTNNQLGINRERFRLIEKAYNTDTNKTTVKLKRMRANDFSPLFELGRLDRREISVPRTPLATSVPAPTGVTLTGVVGGFEYTRNPVRILNYLRTEIMVELVDPVANQFTNKGDSNPQTYYDTDTHHAFANLVDKNKEVNLRVTFVDIDQRGNRSNPFVGTVTSLDQRKDPALRGFAGPLTRNKEFQMEGLAYDTFGISGLAASSVAKRAEGSWEVGIASHQLPGLASLGINPEPPGFSALPAGSTYEWLHQFATSTPVGGVTGDNPVGWTAGWMPTQQSAFPGNWGESGAPTIYRLYRTISPAGVKGDWLPGMGASNLFYVPVSVAVMNVLPEFTFRCWFKDANGEDVRDWFLELQEDEFFYLYWDAPAGADPGDISYIVFKNKTDPFSRRVSGQLVQSHVEVVHTFSKTDVLTDAMLRGKSKMRLQTEIADQPGYPASFIYDDWWTTGESPPDNQFNPGSYWFEDENGNALSASNDNMEDARRLKLALYTTDGSNKKHYYATLQPGDWHRFNADATKPVPPDQETDPPQRVSRRIGSVTVTSTLCEIRFTGQPIVLEARPPRLTARAGLRVLHEFSRPEIPPARVTQEIYRLVGVETPLPIIAADPQGRTNSTFLPTGWSRTILSPTDALPFLMQASRYSDDGENTWSDFANIHLVSRPGKDGDDYEDITVLLDAQGAAAPTTGTYAGKPGGLVVPSNSWGYDRPGTVTVDVDPSETVTDSRTYTFSDGDVPFTGVKNFKAQWRRKKPQDAVPGDAVTAEWEGPFGFRSNLSLTTTRSFKQYRAWNTDDASTFAGTRLRPLNLFSTNISRFIYIVIPPLNNAPQTARPNLPPGNADVPDDGTAPPGQTAYAALRWRRMEANNINALAALFDHETNDRMWIAHAQRDHTDAVWDNWQESFEITQHVLDIRGGVLSEGFQQVVKFLLEEYILPAELDDVLELEPPPVLTSPVDNQKWVNEADLPQLLRDLRVPNHYVLQMDVELVSDPSNEINELGITSSTGLYWIYSQPFVYPVERDFDDLVRLLGNKLLPTPTATDIGKFLKVNHRASATNWSTTWETVAGATTPAFTYTATGQGTSTTAFSVTAGTTGTAPTGNWDLQWKFSTEQNWRDVNAQTGSTFNIGVGAATPAARTIQYQIRKGTAAWSRTFDFVLQGTTANYQIAFSSVTTTAITATASGGPTSGQWRMRYREDDTSAWTTRSYQNSASFRITGLKQGTTYEFQASKGTSGNFGPSVPAEQATNTASISTLGRPTTTLHSIRVGGQGDSVQVSCSQVSGATGYDFYISTSSATPNTSATVAATSSDNLLRLASISAQAGRTNYVWSRATNASGKGPWSSSSLSVVIDSAPTDPTYRTVQQEMFEGSRAIRLRGGTTDSRVATGGAWHGNTAVYYKFGKSVSAPTASERETGAGAVRIGSGGIGTGGGFGIVVTNEQGTQTAISAGTYTMYVWYEVEIRASGVFTNYISDVAQATITVT